MMTPVAPAIGSATINSEAPANNDPVNVIEGEGKTLDSNAATDTDHN